MTDYEQGKRATAQAVTASLIVVAIAVALLALLGGTSSGMEICQLQNSFDTCFTQLMR